MDTALDKCLLKCDNALKVHDSDNTLVAMMLNVMEMNEEETEKRREYERTMKTEREAQTLVQNTWSDKGQEE